MKGAPINRGKRRHGAVNRRGERVGVYRIPGELGADTDPSPRHPNAQAFTVSLCQWMPAWGGFPCLSDTAAVCSIGGTSQLSPPRLPQGAGSSSKVGTTLTQLTQPAVCPQAIY